MEAYARGEREYDATYAGKILRVTGIVERVGKTGLDEPMVLLAGGKSGIRATFATAAGLEALKRTDIIVIRCTGENMYEPRLEGCVLEERKVD